MAKNRDERFSTMSGLAEALTTIGTVAPAQSPLVPGAAALPPAAPVQPDFRFRRWRWIIVGVVGLAVLTLGAALWLRRGPDRQVAGGLGAASPTLASTLAPSATPVAALRAPPTQTPTSAPTASPTVTPTSTTRPTRTPTQTPTSTPTARPTVTPTPTSTPTTRPTVTPTPTTRPTRTPTPQPAWVTDFAEPILAAIAERTPDFEDDFSTPDGGWNLSEWCADLGRRLNYENGEMTMLGDECWAWRDMWYPDFVAEMDARFLPGTPADSQWKFKYRHMGGGVDAASNVYEFYFGGRVMAGLVGSDPPHRDKMDLTQLYGVALSGLNVNHVLVIAKGQAFALYINGRPVFYKIGIPIWPNGGIRIDLDDTVALDNFKIWDISDISLTATPAP
jgi:hypothetical protein